MSEVVLGNHIEELNSLATSLIYAQHLSEKVKILNEFSLVKKFLNSTSSLTKLYDSITQEEFLSFLFQSFHIENGPEISKEDFFLYTEIVIKSLIAIDQFSIVFGKIRIENDQSILILLNQLITTELFYAFMGGIVGYHVTVLTNIVQKSQEHNSNNIRYLHPEGINIDQKNEEVSQLIMLGLMGMTEYAEIYAVGGAGDRLNLKDETSGNPLPAACLPFLGKSLLVGMIRDLQAREFLYYKLYQKQLLTPIALMTSQEKNNHFHIERICQMEQWFGRPKQSFFLFMQPLIPVVTKLGKWVMSSPESLMLKPGGHGVIWKLAQEQRVFHWLKTKNQTKAIIRQINNPIAGLDHLILAMLGQGISQAKIFGFASCPRPLKAAEGMLVLKEKQKYKNEFEYAITNIEYTQYQSLGLTDAPAVEGSPFSQFPSNTNLLFADLLGIEGILHHDPIPGLMVNMKTKVPVQNEHGEVHELACGRLESMMQNIADSITKTFSKPISIEEQAQLPTFVLYNQRKKTLSTTKNAFKEGKPIQDTPEVCFYDFQTNAWDLLVNECGMKVPIQNTLESYIELGPNTIFLYHPALGPLYSIISQKIKGGSLAEKGEIQLEIAELMMQNVNVDGSLLIQASAIMGQKNSQGLIIYNSEDCGKCYLKNVSIINKGIDREKTNKYWSNDIIRKEALTILIEGNGEFHAENIKFDGNHMILVPDGYKITARQIPDEKIEFHKEKIVKPNAGWKYSNVDNFILLESEF